MLSFEKIRNGYIGKGDCLELMKEIPDNHIDMVLCDLPYGNTDCGWDTIIPFEDLWAAYDRIVKPNGAIVLTATAKFTMQLAASNLKDYRYKWVWKKKNSVGFLNCKRAPLRNHEDVLVFYKKQPTYNPQMTVGAKPYTTKASDSHHAPTYKAVKTLDRVNTGTRYPKDILEFGYDKDKVHPTQKPVALGEYLIKTYTNPEDVVLDNCFGSGSFLVAAQCSGRKFIGCELNEYNTGSGGKTVDYYEEAKKRILAS
ncbi:site-specific DNA-methyltransferase [Acetobacter pasteurianus]|uniref:Methyltransferase n=1 Tax=Acetobacter pasteurianus subsp. pasteurianus TaxID=481145 RepID=A0A1Y0YAS2_ACEPA|nr:site-specific DNA-methyltransferase [Acetobacter pasteurianus]ARW49497.1 Site-specific DNA-methyltransferase (adenine-specific) [Acetobacter pasteurianus subsp. pasteurianus]